MIDGEIGFIQEPARNETLAVGVTSVIVSEARTQQNPRKVLIVRNTSGAANQIITINLGANPAVADKGIVLRQSESFADSSETGYECFQGVITAISAVAASQLSIMER